MANAEWVEIFESYTPEELANHVTELKSQVSVFSQQNVGSKSYIKDLAELRGQLSAAVRVQKGRSRRGNESVGVTDFRRVT